MFIFSSVSCGLEFWSVNHTSITWNSELIVCKKIKFVGEASSNWPNGLLRKNV